MFSGDSVRPSRERGAGTSVLLMARTTARKADARIHDLALTIEALRLSRGVSKRQLALKSGVDPSHLGKFLDGGKAGLSLEQVSNVLHPVRAGAAQDHRPGAGTARTAVRNLIPRFALTSVEAGSIMSLVTTDEVPHVRLCFLPLRVLRRSAPDRV